MTDHLANSWENTVGSLVEGDPVVALSWLHNGVKLALHVEKVCPASAGDPPGLLAEGWGTPCLCSSGLLPWPWAGRVGEFFLSKEKACFLVPDEFWWGSGALFLLAL